MFAKLKEYHRKHGDWCCLVPSRYKEDPYLGEWVLRQHKKRCELDSDRISRLESLGFVWVPHDRQSEEMFAKLEIYCNQNGDCLVPEHYEDDPSLGQWVSKQRSCREGLDPTRHHKLEALGFNWNAYDPQWENMFAKLEEHRDEKGDFLVLYHYKHDPSLGKWLANMRHRRDNLDPTCQERLESIGFVWQVKLKRVAKQQNATLLYRSSQ
jgi:hypothetical protein